MRDASPTVVLVPGIGMFSFGKNKTESRITGEFYTNAIDVMQGASALGAKTTTVKDLPQAGAAAPCEAFEVYTNYVALPALRSLPHRVLAAGGCKDPPPAAEERAQPQNRAHRRRRQRHRPEVTVLLAAERGAHVMIADRDLAGAESVAQEVRATAGKEAIAATARSTSAIAKRSLPLCARLSPVRRPRHPHQHRGHLPLGGVVDRSDVVLQPLASTSPQTSARGGGRKASSPPGSSMPASFSPAPPTPSFPSGAAKRTTSARPR